MRSNQKFDFEKKNLLLPSKLQSNGPNVCQTWIGVIVRLSCSIHPFRCFKLTIDNYLSIVCVQCVFGETYKSAQSHTQTYPAESNEWRREKNR